MAEAQKLHYETQITLLKSEHEKAIEKLELENRSLHREVERLKQELGKRPEPVHKSQLSALEINILVFIARNEETTYAQITEKFGLSAGKLQFHATDLEERGFVDNHWNYGVETCTIRQEGLRYLNERNLLN